MGRFLLAILVVVALLTNGSVRAHVQPYAHFVLDPVYEWSAHSQVKEIARLVQTDAATGREVPNERTFTAFLEHEYPDDEHPDQDPWGTPYFLRRDGESLVIGSAGRDREPDTGDDIVSAPVSGQQQ